MVPLKSIRVLDLTRLLPGPYCTMLLADFGAEVIKVEDPMKGDYARAQEPKVDENSAFFHSLNRNKKSVCLNLKSDEEKQYFFHLVEKADVVVESFRPGVMEKLGLNYNRLKRINPELIYCAITGHGQTGPYKEKPGHDINYISYAGLLDVMGEKDQKPTVPAAQIADIGGGALPATIGILLALLERERSGRGQFVDVSMLDGVLSWLQTLLPGFLTNQVQPKRGKQPLSGALACYEVYQTKDQRWLSVGALEPKFWSTFCKTIGKEEFIPKLGESTNEQNVMKKEIQKIIQKKTLHDWMEEFNNQEACVAPVLTFNEVITNPQVLSRQMIQSTPQQEETLQHLGIPIKLSETPGTIRTKAPELGEHTNETLKKFGLQKE
ncbi:Crotonobetainyl-CoA:carnitine CoA-transferase CaiB [Salinibacillus kushneri]|uniref:Crotonobetainyl-CoA:carnitine CoA-transferase CaiB n=1 Tax=Salinibacillus kushneri TaxID=237682 RepID=A0A1I0FPR0_9BACI|nr:CaiB/BaiF CoA-transferase family protein [Salinibacillus kushneri]SET59506.1 Crotonobetainyl-CoA:carnitine CoA-transferase CaiB [Salinibacillus kushneri]